MNKPPTSSDKDWREPHKQLDLVDWLHAKANALPWPGRLVRKRKARHATKAQVAELEQQVREALDAER